MLDDISIWKLLIFCATGIATLWLCLEYRSEQVRNHIHNWERIGKPYRLIDSGTRACGGQWRLDCWRQYWSCQCGAHTFTDSGPEAET